MCARYQIIRSFTDIESISGETIDLSHCHDLKFSSYKQPHVPSGFCNFEVAVVAPRHKQLVPLAEGEAHAVTLARRARQIRGGLDESEHLSPFSILGQRSGRVTKCVDPSRGSFVLCCGLRRFLLWSMQTPMVRSQCIPHVYFVHTLFGLFCGGVSSCSKPCVFHIFYGDYAHLLLLCIPCILCIP